MDGKSTTDREQGMAVLKATRGAYDAGRVLIVHYECGRLVEGEIVPVHAIAVKDPAANRTKTFLACDGEAEALTSFAKFAESHGDWCWLHWNMRNATYGFEHIQARLHQACKGARFILSDNRPDLGFVFWQVYGDMPNGNRGKLQGLCDANSITTENALAPDEIQDEVKDGHWPAVQASALRKVEMIQTVWSRMLDGSLRPVLGEANTQDKATGKGNSARKGKKKRGAKPFRDAKVDKNIYDARNQGCSYKELARNFFMDETKVRQVSLAIDSHRQKLRRKGQS